MSEPTPTLTQGQIEYAKMAYELAKESLDDQNEFQQHLWRRFRDTIRLCLVITAVAGGALSKANVHDFFGIVVAVISSSSMVAMLAASWHLHSVFKGSEYQAVGPESLISAIQTRGSEFDQGDFEYLPEDIFPPRSTDRLRRGGAIASAVMGQVYEDLMQTTLKAALANKKQNLRRSRELFQAREWVNASLWLALVAWGCVLLAQ